ncbi:relaxase domain-containing protein [Streptomyces microflavus]|uniref:relaxase domain-containing protein n=1 Tax=Streptomyces microflavus TaxID=1919 RepID=UPI003B216222
MEIAGVPHELIRWTSRRSDQITACLTELEHEYVTAVDDDGEPRFLPVVSERARAKLNQIAARKTRPPKQKTLPLAQLRAWWKTSAILTSGVAADIITSLLEHARAAAAAIRARIAAVADIVLAAVDVAATVFVMNDGGRFHRRHLLAETRRHLALVLRGRRREPGLDDRIVATAISTYCLDISEPKTVRGLANRPRPRNGTRSGRLYGQSPDRCRSALLRLDAGRPGARSRRGHAALGDSGGRPGRGAVAGAFGVVGFDPDQDVRPACGPDVRRGCGWSGRGGLVGTGCGGAGRYSYAPGEEHDGRQEGGDRSVDHPAGGNHGVHARTNEPGESLGVHPSDGRAVRWAQFTAG